MKTERFMDVYEIPKYTEVLIVYSDNLKCFEQHNFLDGERTLVLICTRDTGYVAVAAKMKDSRYLTLKRWMVTYPGGFSFSIPSTEKYRLKCVPVKLLLGHYRDEQHLWKTIEKHTRSHVVLPLPHGNTA